MSLPVLTCCQADGGVAPEGDGDKIDDDDDSKVKVELENGLKKEEDTLSPLVSDRRNGQLFFFSRNFLRFRGAWHR